MHIILSGIVLTAGILNLIMGTVIFFGSREKSRSLPFALFSFSTFLVALSYWFIHNSAFPASVRVSYSLGSLIPTFLLAWIYQYSSTSPRQRITNLIYTAGGFFFVLPFLGDLMISGISKSEVHGFLGEKGVLFPLYIGFFVAAYAVVLIRLVQLSRTEKRIERKQNRLILTGFSLFGGLGILCGQILPYFGYDQFTDLDVPASIIFIGFTSYAIVHYRWMNIRVIAAEIMAALISGMALLDVFLAEGFGERIYKSVSFLIITVLSVFMVRSVIHEISQKEKLQKLSDKLSAANDRLRELDTARIDFLSTASHQMRTPITTARGYLSLFLEGSYGDVTEKQKDTLNKLNANNDRMSRLIEDLLNTARIESGRMEFNFVETDIDALCREVIDSLMLKAGGLGLYLKYETPEKPLPKLMIDGPKIREVISNLVDNAVKYTPSGGVTVRAEHENNHVRVTVIDTGIGIPETELPYLFAKFSRGKDLSRLNAGGTGLGLYVAKNMVEKNGGKIRAESGGEGRGSRFKYSSLNNRHFRLFKINGKITPEVDQDIF